MHVVLNSLSILRMWKKATKADGIASVGIDYVANSRNTKFIRWKVHGDWVQQVCVCVFVNVKLT